MSQQSCRSAGFSDPGRSFRVLLLGFGNVGRQLARILALERDRFPQLANLRIQVVGITTGTRGVLVDPEGVDLGRALEEVERFDSFLPSNPQSASLDSLLAARELDYDALIELTPLNIESGGEPALSFVRTALRRGKHVITANKGPIAFHYLQLRELAAKQNCSLLFESTVMDGTPVFSLARQGLRGCRILGVSGILNSTSNFVLSRMEEGVSCQQAVHIAQEEGFAEADPRYDLEGWDSAAKICVLANALMNSSITPGDVRREGIDRVSPEEVRAALRAGRRLKPVSRTILEAQGVQAEVKIESLPRDHPFCMVGDRGGVLRISTDLLTPFLIVQQDPTLYDTAYGVVNDLLQIIESHS